MKTMLGYALVAFLGLLFLSSAPVKVASTPKKDPAPKTPLGEDFLEAQSAMKFNQPSMRTQPPVSVKLEQSSVMEEMQALDQKCRKIEALLRRHGK